MLYINFKVEGAEELSRVLGSEDSKLKDFTEPLQKSSDVILKDIRINFASEGGLVGGWTPLAEATKIGRIRRGYGGEHSILVNTGKYKNSFKAMVSSTKTVIDAWGVAYHKYHQSTETRTSNLPRRATLFLRPEVKAEIQRFFQEYLKFNKG